MAGQVAAGVAEQELDLLRQRPRLERDGGDRRVGGADDHPSQPGHGEEHPPVVGVRHQHRAVAGQETPVEHQVHSLAGRQQRLGARLVEAAHRVGEDAGGVDHHPRRDLERLAALLVARRHAGDQPMGAMRAGGLEQADHAHGVDRHAPQVVEGAGEGDGEPRVVELRIVIDHAAAQAGGLDRRQQRQRLGARQRARRSQAEAAGEQVVDLEAGAVERPLPPLVARHHEAQVAHQVGSVAQQQPALAQRFDHQREVALPQVTDAAVRQLGAAARGPLGEVVTLEQRGAVAARRGVDRRPQAGRAAADHQHVPRPPRGELAGQPRERPLTIHRTGNLSSPPGGYRESWYARSTGGSPLGDGGRRASG